MRSLSQEGRFSLLFALFSLLVPSAASAGLDAPLEAHSILAVPGTAFGDVPGSGALHAIRTGGLVLAREIETRGGWIERTYSGGSFEVFRVDSAEGGAPLVLGEKLGAGIFLEFRTHAHPARGNSYLSASIEITETGPLGLAGAIVRLTGPTTSSFMPIPPDGHIRWQAARIDEWMGTDERSWGSLKREFR
jgi:hypothetical protein